MFYCKSKGLDQKLQVQTPGPSVNHMPYLSLIVSICKTGTVMPIMAHLFTTPLLPLIPSEEKIDANVFRRPLIVLSSGKLQPSAHPKPKCFLSTPTAAQQSMDQVQADGGSKLPCKPRITNNQRGSAEELTSISLCSYLSAFRPPWLFLLIFFNSAWDFSKESNLLLCSVWYLLRVACKLNVAYFTAAPTNSQAVIC